MEKYKLYNNSLICVLSRNDVQRKYILPLVEITSEDLAILRMTVKMGFVFKKEQKLYFADISELPKYVHITFDFGEISHHCITCKFHSALPDELGGCAKCRNRCKELEKFPWILLGYETWGTSGDVMMILYCLKYEWIKVSNKPKKEITTKERVILASYIWPWVTNAADLNKALFQS